MQLSGETLEHEIADVVPIGVVHPFKTVDVENHHRQRAASLTRGFDHGWQAALERAAIVESGQRVVERHLYRLLNGLAQPIGVTFLANVRPHPGQEFVSIDRTG